MKAPRALIAIAMVASMSARAAAPVPVHVEVLRGELAERIHKDILQRVNQDAFWGAIVIEKDDHTILQAGYGWANREHGTPFTTATVAQIGSLTKQFTAAVIADLEHRGKLDFADPLSKYLPDAPAAAAHITIEQLLTHTSGLAVDCGGDFDHVTRSDLVTRCLAKVDHEPGSRFQYSNLGYSALAAVAERVTGQSLEAILQERFLKPLHMTRTGYLFSPAMHKEQAIGYMANGTQPPISDRLREMNGSLWNLEGNGGMEASAEDMVRWYHALTKRSAIDDAVKRAVLTPHSRRDAEVEYGYGWFIRRNASGEIEQASHTGSDGVFFSAIVWRPRDRTFYYLVTNRGEKSGGEVASAILRALRP
jgi:CubicO group peptidase (beta-lactamase class C family)